MWGCIIVRVQVQWILVLNHDDNNAVVDDDDCDDDDMTMMTMTMMMMITRGRRWVSVVQLWCSHVRSLPPFHTAGRHFAWDENGDDPLIMVIMIIVIMVVVTLPHFRQAFCMWWWWLQWFGKDHDEYGDDDDGDGLDTGWCHPTTLPASILHVVIMVIVIIIIVITVMVCGEDAVTLPHWWMVILMILSLQWLWWSCKSWCWWLWSRTSWMRYCNFWWSRVWWWWLRRVKPHLQTGRRFS